MRKFISVCCFILALGLVNFKAIAGHLLGAEIAYSCIAPNTYVAEVKAYYDCGSVATGAAQTMQLNLKAPGCATTQVITANKVGNNRIMQSYCAAFGNNCNTSQFYIISEVHYSATFTISGQCPEYYLTVQECGLGAMANLGGPTNPTSTCLYLSAYINSAATGNAISSPAFMEIPTVFFNINSPATIPNLAIDRSANGLDSIGYSLKPALENANVPISYTGGTTYSNPIPSTSGVNLNPASGLLTFTPNVYNQGSFPFNNNAYAVVVEASGYKKINGVMTKVSAIQRRYPVALVNYGSNQNPQITSLTVNGLPLPASGIADVFAGSSMAIQFGTTDANAADSVFILNPGSNLPAFTSTAGKNAAGSLSLNLSSEGLVWIPVIIKDNACPVLGITTQMVGVNVQKALGFSKNSAANNGFTVFPNPFNREVYFRISKPIKAEIILIYNLLGQQVDAFSFPEANAGEKTISWQNADKFAAGTYVAKLISADKTVQTLKFSKLK